MSIANHPRSQFMSPDQYKAKGKTMDKYQECPCSPDQVRNSSSKNFNQLVQEQQLEQSQQHIHPNNHISKTTKDKLMLEQSLSHINFPNSPPKKDLLLDQQRHLEKRNNNKEKKQEPHHYNSITNISCDLTFNNETNFNIDEKVIGEGEHAIVKVVRNTRNNSFMAVKICQLQNSTDNNNANNIAEINDTVRLLEREMKIHRQLRHPNIIRFYDYYKDKKTIFMLLALSENGNVYQYLKMQQKVKLQEDEVFPIFFQLCLAVDFMHRKKILHRNIKPENILLDQFMNTKLADFGMSAKVGGPYNSNKKNHSNSVNVSKQYIPPEALNENQFDESGDIWQIGICLYEMLHGHLPQINLPTTPGEPFQLMFNSRLSHDVTNLISLLLVPTPSARISFSDIFSHEWTIKNIKEYDLHFIMKKEFSFNRQSLQKLMHRLMPFGQSQTLLIQENEEDLKMNNNNNQVQTDNSYDKCLQLSKRELIDKNDIEIQTQNSNIKINNHSNHNDHSNKFKLQVEQTEDLHEFKYHQQIPHTEFIDQNQNQYQYDRLNKQYNQTASNNQNLEQKYVQQGSYTADPKLKIAPSASSGNVNVMPFQLASHESHVTNNNVPMRNNSQNNVNIINNQNSQSSLPPLSLTKQQVSAKYNKLDTPNNPLSQLQSSQPVVQQQAIAQYQYEPPSMVVDPYQKLHSTQKLSIDPYQQLKNTNENNLKSQLKDIQSPFQISTIKRYDNEQEVQHEHNKYLQKRYDSTEKEENNHCNRNQNIINSNNQNCYQPKRRLSCVKIEYPPLMPNNEEEYQRKQTHLSQQQIPTIVTPQKVINVERNLQRVNSILHGGSGGSNIADQILSQQQQNPTSVSKQYDLPSQTGMELQMQINRSPQSDCSQRIKIEPFQKWHRQRQDMKIVSTFEPTKVISYATPSSMQQHNSHNLQYDQQTISLQQTNHHHHQINNAKAPSSQKLNMQSPMLVYKYETREQKEALLQELSCQIQQQQQNQQNQYINRDQLKGGLSERHQNMHQEEDRNWHHQNQNISYQRQNEQSCGIIFDQKENSTSIGNNINSNCNYISNKGQNFPTLRYKNMFVQGLQSTSDETANHEQNFNRPMSSFDKIKTEN